MSCVSNLSETRLFIFSPTPKLIDTRGRESWLRSRWMTAAGVQGSTKLNEFAFEDGSVNLVTSAIGFKYNPGRNLLVSVNVLFPLTNAGMRANPVPVFGFDYAF